MSTQQQKIAQHGTADSTYTLEFRTWNGSAYVWTDYTSRLIDFSGIGSTVEEGAFPNAFRMSVGRLELDNTDGMFNDLDVLDGLLYNSTEPYGQSIYKRILRIKCNGTAIGVALVRDVKPRSDKSSVIIETISLDARAADQSCDGITAERHPLGSDDKASASTWTTSAPAALTDEVAMYRWRDEESEGNLSYGWFKDRHYSDIIQATAWALDDLATDITETYRLMTADGREIATTRNIPPDDPAVSTGVTTDRTGAIIWNPERNVLVVCVGHKIYDYNPTTNVYTLRNTLTAGRDVVRAFYTTEADAGGENKRIVLVQCDIDTYASTSGTQVTSAWCTVLDAEGAGAYTLLKNEGSLGADVFPGTHFVRALAIETPGPPVRWVSGQYLLDNKGENDFIPFRQIVRLSGSGFTVPDIWHTDDDDWAGADTIFGEPGGTRGVLGNDRTLGRGYISSWVETAPGDGDLKYTHGGFFNAALSEENAGGQLWFWTFDNAALGWRLRAYGLSTYALQTHISSAAGPTSGDSPNNLCCHNGLSPQLLFFSAMQFVNTGTSYSVGRVGVYDIATPGTTYYTFLSGATGTNQAWMVQDLGLMDDGGALRLCATLFNRETHKYRFCNDVAEATWAGTNANCETGFQNGIADQDNRLQGLIENTNYSTNRIYFVEWSVNRLWAFDGTDLIGCNKTPANATSGDPINSDTGMSCPMCVTEVNYPDSDTPNGILFGVTANDNRLGADHPSGQYVLWQYANYDPGFIQLLDVSGLSFWELRTLIAEAFGFVHYYSGDGTLVFKPRTTSGSASFTFSDANRNYLPGEVQTRGFEAVLNDITVKPYAIVSQNRTSDPVRGDNENIDDRQPVVDFDFDGSQSIISGNPGENATWKILFVSATTYDLYKLAGDNFSATTAKASAQSINSFLRAPTDGSYLTIAPNAFSGVFLKDDNFTFDVFEPEESLQSLDDRDIQKWSDATSIEKYKRNARTFENRFIRRQIAPDYAANIGTWRAARHDIVRIGAASDPAYQPLLRCTLTDLNMGYSAVTFQIMGVEHRRNQPSTLTLAKV